jgi:phosphodiesterase/alkaline phosphatase D-like protein
VRARPGDAAGRFWRWDVDGLRAGRPHGVRLLDGRGRSLAEPWRIRTFPAPQSRPRSVRLLVFTCAGGHDVFFDAGVQVFQLARVRNRLLQRGLSFRPDAVIANGDHVYWDLEAGATAAVMGRSETGRSVAVFDRSTPARNAAQLTRVVGPQIVDVYGVDCRSVPVFFLTDDHDYFENDHADETIITFPPPTWKLRLARQSQRLYYPEFLGAPGQPDGLPFTRRGVHECFGALRYGRLLELLMYDVRRSLTLRGRSAVFFHPAAERWVRRRIASRDVTHVVNMPSNPPGWSAGKWAEWYPDVLDGQGRLVTDRPKPYWQPGWLAQHDRLIQAISERRRGVPLVVGGDLHATAAGTIRRSGRADLSANPVHVALSGTLGSRGAGFPSGLRGTAPKPAGHVDLHEQITPLEENGFLIADVTTDKITLRFFRWNDATQSEADIDRLEPFRTIELEPA